MARIGAPGATGAPKLQPIETRLVMLQTGMRAPMGIKLRAPNLETLDQMAVELERLVREVPAVRRETVNAERVMGKPYLEIDIDRRAIAQYGIDLQQVQDVIEIAIGGKMITTTVEGRERYPVAGSLPATARPLHGEACLAAAAGSDQRDKPAAGVGNHAYTYELSVGTESTPFRLDSVGAERNESFGAPRGGGTTHRSSRVGCRMGTV